MRMAGIGGYVRSSWTSMASPEYIRASVSDDKIAQRGDRLTVLEFKRLGRIVVQNLASLVEESNRQCNQPVGSAMWIPALVRTG